MLRFGVTSLALLLSVWSRGSEAAPVVLYADDMDAVRASAAASTAIGTADLQVAGSLTDLIALPPDTPIVVGAATRPCASPGTTTLQGALVEAKRQMLDVEYGNALDILRGAEAGLPCGTAGSALADLHELYFLIGIAEFNEGRADASRAAFRQAATIAPSRPWNDDYPPSGKEIFLEALQQTIAVPPRPLDADVPNLAVDGTTVDVSTPGPLLLGGHLLRSGGTTLWLDVGEGPAVLVTTPQRLRDGLLRGDARYGGWLAAVADARGWSDVVLVRADAVLRFQGGKFVPIDTEPVRVTRLRPPPLALVGGGAGLAILGFAIHGGTYRAGVAIAEEPGRSEEYGRLLGGNRAGFALGVVGVLAATTGAVVTVAELVTGKPLIAMPFAAPGPEGVAFGIAGRLP